MKFRKRLLYYFVGILIGMMLVYFYFGDRELGNWLPQKNIKNTILNNKFHYNSITICELTSKEINKDLLLEIINKGKIIFKKSKTKDIVKHYFIEYKNYNIIFLVNFEEKIISIKSNNIDNCRQVSSKTVVVNNIELFYY